MGKALTRDGTAFLCCGVYSRAPANTTLKSVILNLKMIKSACFGVGGLQPCFRGWKAGLAISRPTPLPKKKKKKQAGCEEKGKGHCSHSIVTSVGKLAENYMFGYYEKKKEA